MVNLRSIAESLAKRQVKLYLLNAQSRIELKMRRFGFGESNINLLIIKNIDEIVEQSAGKAEQAG